MFNWFEKIKVIEVGDCKVKIGLLFGWMMCDFKIDDVVLYLYCSVVLCEIFDLYVEGYGLFSIVVMLNVCKELSWLVGKKDKGNGWNMVYFYKLLINCVVFGEYIFML